MANIEKRISLYVGAPLQQLLDGHDNRSGRLNGVAERYLAVIADELSRLPLTRGEWLAVMDVCNGGAIGEGADGLSWQLVWASVQDSPEMDAKWGVDHEALAAKLRRLPLVARAAVWEATLRFWAQATEAVSYDQQLADIGVTVAPDVTAADGPC